VRTHSWRPRVIPVYGLAALAGEPAMWMGSEISQISPGFIAIGASFLLFALGGLVAFTKTKWTGGKPTQVVTPDGGWEH